MNDIKHYGVLGMRWGIRKDRKTGKKRKTSEVLEEIKKNKEKKENDKYKKEREKVLNNPRKLAKREVREMYNISTEEAQRMLNIFSLEKRLNDIHKDNLEKPKRYIDMIMGYMDTIDKVNKRYKQIQVAQNKKKSETKSKQK